MSSRSTALAALLGAAALAAAPAKPVTPVAVMFLAPNYPGTTEEAQPRMDGLASTLVELSGRAPGSITATYHNREQTGLAQLADGGVGALLAPLPLYLSRKDELRLTPRLLVVQQGLGATQAWALVAKKGAVKSAADLDGATIFSTAGYVPGFVTSVALAGFGKVPASAKVTTGTQVLSALRKVARDGKMVAVLDEEQTKALATLPFGAELEVVHTSASLPVAVVATVGSVIPEDQWKALAKAFLGLDAAPQGKTALEGVRLQRFVPLEEAALTDATTRFRAAK